MENNFNEKAEFDHSRKHHLDGLKGDTTNGAKFSAKVYARSMDENLKLSEVLEQELTKLKGSELTKGDLLMFTLGMMQSKADEAMEDLVKLSEAMEKIQGKTQDEGFSILDKFMNITKKEEKKQPFDINDLMKEINKDNGSEPNS